MSNVYNEIVSKLEELTDEELTNLISKIRGTGRVMVIGNWYNRDHIKSMYPGEFRDWKIKKSLGEIDTEDYYKDLFESLIDCVGDGSDSAFDEIDYQVRNNDSQLWEYGISQ